MKSFLIIILAFFCFNSKEPFKLLESTRTYVAAGRMESGTTETYTFKLVPNFSSRKLVFDQIWIDSLFYDVKPIKQNKDLTFANEFKKNDTITLSAVIRKLPDESGSLKISDFTVKKRPENFEGKAIIGYKIKGKRKYITVNDFVKTKAVYMP